MGLLDDLIRNAQQSGGGGLGDILGRMGQSGGPSASGSVLEEIQRRMGGGSPQQPTTGGGTTTAPQANDISIDDLERQMGIGRGNRGSNYQQQPYQPQQYPQQQPYQPQQQYPQQEYQQPYQPSEPSQPTQETTAPKSSGGGLMSILKIIGMGAIAMMIMKKFRK